jgi:hypothetical protein
MPQDPPVIEKELEYFDIKTQQNKTLDQFQSEYLAIVFLELGNHDFFANLTLLNECFKDSDLHIIIFYVGNKAFYPNEHLYFADANDTAVRTLIKHPFSGNLAIFNFYIESCYYYNHRFMLTLIHVQSWEVVGYENLYSQEKLYSLYLSVGLEPISIPSEYSKFYDKPNKTIGFNLISLLLIPILFRKRKTNDQ